MLYRHQIKFFMLYTCWSSSGKSWAVELIKHTYFESGFEPWVMPIHLRMRTLGQQSDLCPMDGNVAQHAEERGNQSSSGEERGCPASGETAQQ